MKEYLNIGEIAKIFGLGVQTLHYYDSIELFRPVERDERTGYRKYRFDQVYQLACIRYMRKIGYSLDDVRNFMDSRNPEDSLSLLKKRSQNVQKKWTELMQIDEAIQRKIHFIEHKRANLQLDSLKKRWFPERYYIPLGNEDNLYMKDTFYLYPTIAFYEKDLKYFGAYLDVSLDGINIDSMGVDPQMTSVIPSGNFLVGYHKGPYETVENRIKQMRKAYQKDPLSISAINFNIIDQFVERNSEYYITEIQIPIKDE